MPLSATYLGARIESWIMSAQEWADLKSEYRVSGLTMSCGQDGIPKTSSVGTQFFAHKAGTACQLHVGGPESPEHLATKVAVAEAARDLGWDAIIECASRDRTWIADVLLSKEGRKLVVEAQWSPQSEADFRRRQERYASAGIECLWLVTEANARNASAVRHHVIAGAADDLTVRLPALTGAITCDLQEGMKRILRGELKPLVDLRAVNAAVLTQMSKCWTCDKWITLWAVTDLQLVSRCGSPVTLEWSDPWPLWAPRRHEEHLVDVVCSAIVASDLPPPVTLARRYSKHAEKHYIAMICPRCDRVQGDGMLDWKRSATSYDVPLLTGPALKFSDRIRVRPHLCGDVGNGFCSQTVTPTGGPISFPPDDEILWITDNEVELLPLPPRRGGLRRPR